MLSRVLFAALIALMLALPAQAAELVMYRRDGCPYCAAFDRAIAPIYPKTEIGRRVPLREVDIGSHAGAAIALKSPVRYTPTFVLAHEGRELGRIEGYSGEDFFWSLLERLLLQHQI